MIDLLSRNDGGLWTAEFRPVMQPSLVKVDVRVARTWIVRGGPDLFRDSVPR